MKLPTYQELSKEQDAINNLPLRGSYLVTGPPGTGKTVIALYRAKMLREQRLDPELVMYNGLLQRYTQSATEYLDIGGTVSTWHKWFYGLHRELTGWGRVPEVESYHPDWDQIKRSSIPAPVSNKRQFVIVDEGQDLAKGFYEVAPQSMAAPRGWRPRCNRCHVGHCEDGLRHRRSNSRDSHSLHQLGQRLERSVFGARPATPSNKRI